MIRFALIGQPEHLQNFLQDTDWLDNATAVTGVSDLAFPTSHGRWPFNGKNSNNNSNSNSNSYQDSSVVSDAEDPRWRILLRRFSGPFLATLAAFLAFASPPTMVALPATGLLKFREAQLRCHVS